RERAQGGDVQHARAALGVGRGLGRQSIDGPQERGEGLAGSGRREHEGVPPRRDGGPAGPLRLGRRDERRLEPGTGGGGEGGEVHDPTTLPRPTDKACADGLAVAFVQVDNGRVRSRSRALVLVAGMLAGSLVLVACSPPEYRYVRDSVSRTRSSGSWGSTAIRAPRWRTSSTVRISAPITRRAS